MKTNLKTLVTVGMAMILTSLAVTSWAACGTPQLIGNYSTGSQLNVVGILDDGSGTGTILTKFWIAGKSTEHNSGALPSFLQSMPWGASDYYIWSDFGDGLVTGDCPAATDSALFLYSMQHNGAGQYLLLGTSYDMSYTGWNFDAITNGNGPQGPNTEVPVDIPGLTVVSAEVSGGMAKASLTWTPIGNLKGFYDVEPASNLITGVAIRYYQGATAPTSFKTADWPVAGVVNFGATGVDPGQADVQVPFDPSLKTYVALTVLFDGGQPGSFTETTFVGAPSEASVYPRVRPSFTSVTATSLKKNTVRVDWTVRDEGNTVNAYAVRGSRHADGPFETVAKAVRQAKGGYSVTVDSDMDFFQVVAYLRDRTTLTSSTFRVR